MQRHPLLWESAAARAPRHAQSLRGFLRLHWRYGQGAFLYQAKRKQRASGTMVEDLGFHRRLPGVVLEKTARYRFGHRRVLGFQNLRLGCRLARGAGGHPPPTALSGDLSVVASHHGAFAENYTAQQLAALGARSLHYWKSPSGEAEVDFLHPSGSAVLPLEIKAGTNVRSRSLGIYTSRFRPPLALRGSLQNLRLDGAVLNVPLYALPALPRLIDLAITPP